MAKYSRVEFLIYLKKIASAQDAENLKRGQSWISTNAKRGNLVLTEDNKTIDTAHKTNKAFVDKYWGEHPELKMYIPAAPQPPQPIPVQHDVLLAPEAHRPAPAKPPKKKEINPANVSSPPEDDTDLDEMDIGDLNEEKIRAYIQKTRSATRLDELKIQKQEGLLVPTEDIRMIIPMFQKTILVACENGFEDFITEVSVQYNISSADVAKYRGKISGLLNTISNTAVEAALKDIDNVVEQTADARGKGEKK